LAIALCKEADLYFIDEPSAYLDAETRIVVSRLIKKFVLKNKKSAFIVEHDFIMATYLADRFYVISYSFIRVILCEG
jgi:ATP-binding cassette subfamily E protein 1